MTRIETAIKSRETNSSLYIALKAQQSWIFNGPTTQFQTHLKTTFKDTRIDVDTVLSQNHTVQGIQPLETILQKIKSHCCCSDDQNSDATCTWANEHGVWEFDSDAINHDAINHDAINHGAINHDAINHDAINHDAINHDAINHDAINHDAINHDAINHDAIILTL